MTRAYHVDDPSRIAEVRRAAAAMGHDEGLSETLAGNVAIVVTEICTNLVKHSEDGEVILSTLSGVAGAGVEILAIDRGPGMRDVERCLADGYSSGESSGIGLGAIARLSQEFDIHSEEPTGTVLVARIKLPESGKTAVGAVLKPMAGEEVSGDAWAVHWGAGATAWIVADGLGHGALACAASSKAIEVFRRSDDYSPVSVLQQVHAALRPTRGAAVSVAYLEEGGSKMRYAGVGNIAGVLAGADKTQRMVSHNGTAGYGTPRLQEFSYVLPEETLLIMHSDGLQTNWNADALRRRDPSVIAGVLYRDASRERDDVCVMVAKMGARD